MEVSPSHWPADRVLTTHFGAISLLLNKLYNHHVYPSPGQLSCGIPRMTDDVQSRGEAIVLKRKLLRRGPKIGSWNVRTLRQTGKLKELCDEGSRCKLDLVGVQEVRWCGQGKLVTSVDIFLLWKRGRNSHFWCTCRSLVFTSL